MGHKRVGIHAKRKEGKRMETAMTSNKTWIGILYIALSAILGTAAALIFVSAASEAGIFLAFLLAVSMWAIPNFVFTKAQTYIPNVATVLIVFSVISTVTDTVGGLALQGTEVQNYFTFVVGLLAGAIVIKMGASSKDVMFPDKTKETVLYCLGGIGLITAYILRDYWYVQVVMYALGDLVGAVLAVRLLRYVPENHKYAGALQFAIGLVAYAPLTFAVVLLLQAMGNVAIAGPSATILSCGTAMIGNKILTGSKMGVKDILFALLAGLCVLLIFSSF